MQTDVGHWRRHFNSVLGLESQSCCSSEHHVSKRRRFCNMHRWENVAPARHRVQYQTKIHCGSPKYFGFVFYVTEISDVLVLFYVMAKSV